MKRTERYRDYRTARHAVENRRAVTHSLVGPVGQDGHVKVLDVDEKDTAAGGLMLKFSVSVVEPRVYRDRLMWFNLNVDHPESEKAVEIGLGEYDSICIGAGFDGMQDDFALLEGKVIGARVKEHESSLTGDFTNEKLGYFSTPEEADVAHVIEPTEPAKPGSTVEFDDDSIPF